MGSQLDIGVDTHPMVGKGPYASIGPWFVLHSMVHCRWLVSINQHHPWFILHNQGSSTPRQQNPGYIARGCLLQRAIIT
jgi:hypothetical protein